MRSKWNLNWWQERNWEFRCLPKAKKRKNPVKNVRQKKTELAKKTCGVKFLNWPCVIERLICSS